MVGLCNRNAVCSGISEILRNVLAARGIECYYVTGLSHAFNQVKINGKWYYTDLTADMENFINGDALEDTLLSSEELRRHGDAINMMHVLDKPQDLEESTESYDKSELRRVQQIAYSSIIGQNKQTSVDFENAVSPERIATGIRSPTATSLRQLEHLSEQAIKL